MRATLDVQDPEKILNTLVDVSIPTMGGLPDIYGGTIRYKKEGAGREYWQAPSETARTGQGDCEDLAVYLAAQRRASGQDPAARVRVVRTGPKMRHALVQRGDGTLEDPSRALGMLGPDGRGNPLGADGEVAPVAPAAIPADPMAALMLMPMDPATRAVLTLLQNKKTRKIILKFAKKVARYFA